MTCRHISAAVALAAGLIVPATSAASIQSSPTDAQQYKYVTVALPHEANTGIADINSFGAYVGASCDATCMSRVQFIATPQGKLTYFTIPFADFVPKAPYLPVGLDDRGDVDGLYTDSEGAVHGYLRSANGATWTKIDDPLAGEASGAGTVPQSISTDGSVIVGYYITSANVQHGFLYRHGAFTTYDVPGASATAVNFYYNGEFGGSYMSTDGASHAFFIKDGELHMIQGASLVAVSKDGSLFGDEFSQQPIVGFAYANGRYTTIRDPDQVGTTSADGTEVSNANLDGVVVGDYTYTAGTSTQPGHLHGFIAIPQEQG
jgi:uncharacterized membrane protein